MSEDVASLKEQITSLWKVINAQKEELQWWRDHYGDAETTEPAAIVSNKRPSNHRNKKIRESLHTEAELDKLTITVRRSHIKPTSAKKQVIVFWLQITLKVVSGDKESMTWVVEKEYRDIILLANAVDKALSQSKEQARSPTTEESISERCPKMFNNYTPHRNDKMKVLHFLFPDRPVIMIQLHSRHN